MKRLLITGATGFIGQQCLPLLLDKDYEIHAVSTGTPQGNPKLMHWHQVDLLDTNKVANLIKDVQPSHLLHFAWYATPSKYWTSLENIRWVQASLDLLQRFVQYGGYRAVIAGTCAEYDWNYGYCSEQVTPLSPKTLYGVCKHTLQMILHAFAKQTNLNMVWGRIFFLYGPYEYPERLVPSVIRSLLNDKPALCSHGNQIRDFLHVMDVAAAFVALLESEMSGIVNIGSGIPISLKEIIYFIADSLNRRNLVQLGAIASSQNEPNLLVADVRRLKEELNWYPNYTLEEGLAQTIEWWSNNKNYYPDCDMQVRE